MWLYEITSGFGNHEFHRFVNLRRNAQHGAGSASRGTLTGGCIYYDAIVSDNRWTMEIVKDGVRNGGLALNYAPVTGMIKENGRLIGVALKDKLGGTAFDAKTCAPP